MIRILFDAEEGMKKPITLYLIGLPGSGKYTIAKELAKSGYKVIDNHLINNPIFSLLDLDNETAISDKAWDSIAAIRDAVFRFIAHHPSANYVFTNVLLEDKEDRAFYDRMLLEAEKRGSLFVPIKLHVASHEHEIRIKAPERKEKFKATSLLEHDKQKGILQIEHPLLLELDVTDLSAKQTAAAILDFVKEVENMEVDKS